VVGGVGAALHGAPVSTFDLDIVHSRAQANVDRLLVALESLEVVYRTQPERKLKPDRSHLASGSHQLLMTRFGPLDVMGTIGRRQDYDDLLPRSEEMAVGGGTIVRVLDLETLIATKEEMAGDKDLATLPILRRTLRELREKGGRTETPQGPT